MSVEKYLELIRDENFDELNNLLESNNEGIIMYYAKGDYIDIFPLTAENEELANIYNESLTNVTLDCKNLKFKFDDENHYALMKYKDQINGMLDSEIVNFVKELIPNLYNRVYEFMSNDDNCDSAYDVTRK